MAIINSWLTFGVLLLHLVNPIGASPYVMNDAIRRDATPTCKGCWTIAAQCSTYSPIPQLVSSMENPPATETAFTATAFCSAFLQNSDFSYTTISSTAGSTTATSTVRIFATSTTTAAPSPTLSVYCAAPTPGMICGLSNGAIIDPVALNEDENETSPVNSAEDCYQRCLANPFCKSYFTSQWINGTEWNCDIFKNSLKNNVVSAVPGSQFFDRGCPNNLPTECSRSEATRVNLSPTATTLAELPPLLGPPLTPHFTTLSATTMVSFTNPSPTVTVNFPPLITSPPKPRAVEAAVLNYSTSLPSYLKNWYATYYGAIIPLACSCLITSASPDMLISVTETQVFYNHTASAKVTEIYTETAFETPYLATIYTTIL